MATDALPAGRAATSSTSRYHVLGHSARAEEQGKWKFVGMLPLFDPPREQAKTTIASAVQMGVKIRRRWLPAIKSP